MVKAFPLLILSCLLYVTPLLSQESSNPKGYKVGGYEVFVINECEQKVSVDILCGANQDIKSTCTPSGVFNMARNVVVVKSRKGVFLIDTGAGVYKKVIEEMSKLGIAPEDVKIVYLTHIHDDHIGGLLDDGKKTFPNAMLSLSSPECDFWSNSDNSYSLSKEYRNNFLTVQKTLNAYGKHLETSDPYPIHFPFSNGINIICAHGHTPGHIAYLIKSGGEQLLIWGDLIHAETVQMLHPEVYTKYDMNPEQAVESRLEILKYVSSNKIPVIGAHICTTTPILIEEVEGGGYKFSPISASEK